jgi:hypothetical protein
MRADHGEPETEHEDDEATRPPRREVTETATNTSPTSSAVLWRRAYWPSAETAPDQRRDQDLREIQSSELQF